jgi:hypothetical protein
LLNLLSSARFSYFLGITQIDSFLNFGYLCKITDEDMKKFTSLLAAAGMILGLASCGSDGYTTAQFTYAENIPLLRL